MIRRFLNPRLLIITFLVLVLSTVVFILLRNIKTKADVTAQTKRIAVVLINFQDTTPAYIADDTRKAFFEDSDSVKSFFNQNSYGKLNLVGDVFGWQTIPMNKPTSVDDDVSSQRLYMIHGMARQQLMASGVNLKDYDLRIYVTSYQIAVRGSYFKYDIFDGPYVSLNCITFTNFHQEVMNQLKRTAEHEMGHWLGSLNDANGHKNINDADRLECKDEFGSATAISADCARIHYGDSTSIMGEGVIRGYNFSGLERYEAGWIDESSLLHVTQSGSYKIYPLDPQDSNVKLISVQRKVDDPNSTFFIDYRQSGISYSGVYLRSSSFENNTTAMSYLINPHAGVSDNRQYMVVGDEIYDPIGNLSFKLIGINSEYATVEINLNPPDPSLVPKLSYSGEQKATLPVWSWPPKSFTGSVSFKMKNNTGVSSTYNLVYEMPSGWTVTSLKSGSTVITDPNIVFSPGEIIGFTLDFTSSASVAVGTYPIGVTATDISDLTRQRSVSIPLKVSEYKLVYDTTNPADGNILFPAENQVISGIYPIIINAIDDVGVSKANLYLGETSIASIYDDFNSFPLEPFIYKWDSRTVANGNYVLKLKLTDTGNHITDKTINISVNNKLALSAPTTVSIVSPSKYASVSGLAPIKVSTTGDITSLALFVDDKFTEYSITPPFDFLLDTSKFSNGNHTISIGANDVLDKETLYSSYIFPVVNNQNLILTLSTDKTNFGYNDELTYTINYQNGPGEVTKVKIEDMVPGNAQFIAGSAGDGTYDETLRKITWNLGTIAPNTSGSVSFKVKSSFGN